VWPFLQIGDDSTVGHPLTDDGDLVTFRNSQVMNQMLMPQTYAENELMQPLLMA
jgi:hypothetical protein